MRTPFARPGIRMLSFWKRHYITLKKIDFKNKGKKKKERESIRNIIITVPSVTFSSFPFNLTP